MAQVDFQVNDAADVAELLLAKVVEEFNAVDAGVAEYKAQGDVEEKADELRAGYEADDAETDQTAISFKLAKIAKAKEMIKRFESEITDSVMAEAQELVNPDFDADRARAAIKEDRKAYTDTFNSVRDTFKILGHIQDETVTDEETGKTTTELVATNRYGNVLLSVASAPNVRATKGGASSAANSEGAKIRAWGKDNGWNTLSDRGPLPQDLKDAYAKANA